MTRESSHIMPANYNNTDLRRPQPHDTYYITGGDLHFLVSNYHQNVGFVSPNTPSLQVEKTLFRVHSHFFIRDSVMFNKLLQPSATAGSHFRKGSESNHIIITDVSSDDFATFLGVFYTPNPCVVIVLFADAS